MDQVVDRWIGSVRHLVVFGSINQHVLPSIVCLTGRENFFQSKKKCRKNKDIRAQILRGSIGIPDFETIFCIRSCLNGYFWGFTLERRLNSISISSRRPIVIFLQRLRGEAKQLSVLFQEKFKHAFRVLFIRCPCVRRHIKAPYMDHSVTEESRRKSSSSHDETRYSVNCGRVKRYMLVSGKEVTEQSFVWTWL